MKYIIVWLASNRSSFYANVSGDSVVWSCKMSPDQEHHAPGASRLNYDEAKRIMRRLVCGRLMLVNS
jgi:hypothetical protein